MEPTAYLVVGLVAIGMGVSFFTTDPRSSTSRPLSLFFVVAFFAAIGAVIVPFFPPRQGGLDPAELVRLLALLAAAPFWIAGMIAPVRWKPIGFALGEVVFLLGAIRYHVVQGQRGQFLARFVSPAVARVVRDRGMASAFQ